MSLGFIMVFSVTVFVASIIPGPSMLLALSHGMTYGVKRTIASAMGNVTVTFVQASISIAGLGTILMASETVFQVVKWAGAVYMIYMGIGILRSSRRLMTLQDMSDIDETITLRKMYMQSVIVTAGNPKAIVFFSAIFPQFINPEVILISQFMMLMGICLLIAFGCFMIYALGGQTIILIFKKSTVDQYFKRLVGSVFVILGIGLAFSRR